MRRVPRAQTLRHPSNPRSGRSGLGKRQRHCGAESCLARDFNSTVVQFHISLREGQIQPRTVVWPRIARNFLCERFESYFEIFSSDSNVRVANHDAHRRFIAVHFYANEALFGVLYRVVDQIRHGLVRPLRSIARYDRIHAPVVLGGDQLQRSF